VGVLILTVGGAILTAGCIPLLAVSLYAEPESRQRFLANWWAITLAYFGTVFMLSGQLVR
jgi:hypothetical protein